MLVSIIRGDEVNDPQEDTILKARDDVVALTKIENEQQLLNFLLGKI